MSVPVKQPSDQAQRDRAARDLETSLLVEAAAGTGKTTPLVERILTILREDKARLRDVAAITEKAAGELKVRLRQTIEALLHRADAPDRPLLQRALTDLDVMSVSTIHSFCAEMLRELPVEAGVEPGFAVTDDLAARLIFDETWEEWLAGQMTPENTVLRRAVELGIRCEPGAGLYSLARTLDDHRDLLDRVKPDEPCDDKALAQTAQVICDLAREIESTLPHCSDRSDNGAQQIEHAIAPLAASDPPDDFDSAIAWVQTLPELNARSGTQKNWDTAVLAAAKERTAELKAHIEWFRGEVNHRVLHDVARYMGGFLEALRQARIRQRALDFHDLLLLSRNMLRDSPAARAHFKRAWRYILVDEFQDTDPLQTEIVFFLSEEADRRANSWEEVRLRPGKLFLVGDPKQSIYSFRRADLDLYGRVKEIMRGQGEVLTLSVNFRTVPENIGELNALFAKWMTGPVNGRYEPEHVPLDPYREVVKEDGGLRLLYPPSELPVENPNAAQWRRMEANCIAQAIRRTVESEERVTCPVTRQPRPTRFGDTAILLRANTALEILEEALRAWDIPYQVAGGKYYYKRVEIRDLLYVLRAIENPCDGFSILHALRSPFFGLSDEDLLRHFLDTGSFNYLAPPYEPGPIVNAFEALRVMHDQRNAHPLPAVIEDLFERTQALQVYAMKPHGEQRAANLLKAIETARRMTRAENITFGGLVRWLSRMERAEEIEGESPVAEADADSVQVMTVHKAKGLEFPLVFLAFMDARKPGRDQCIVERDAGRMHLNLGSGLNTRSWEEAEALHNDRTEHEERRLFYVATTRARDRLYLPVGWGKGSKQGFLNYVRPRYGDRENLPETSAPAVLATDDMDLQVTRRDELRMKPSLTGPLTGEAKSFWLHRQNWQADLAERASQLDQGQKVTTATDATRDAEPWPESVAPVQPGVGRKVGSLVHAALEHAAFDSPEKVETLVRALAPEYDLPGEAVDNACALAARCLDLPVMHRARVARACYREMPFTVATERGLLEGRMDLVFIEEDGAVIVDYKTDAIEECEAVARAEHHRPQGEAYAEALAAVLDRPVKEVVFLFLHPGVGVAVPVGRGAP